MTEWWRGAVLYQIYPRSFRDANGDGVGDLAGIAETLDYVAALGVDGIWLSPFYPSPMKDFGYDVADYCDVDPLFGTLEDFDRLMARAHALGLKVIVDQVYSHTSDRHPWFAESRASRDNGKADWYVWADPKPDGTPPNNWLSVFGGVAWAWEPRRRQYHLHNFLAEQPDLNLHNPAVQDAILEVARFWLDLGVDGFRLDAANFYMHDRGLRDNPPSGATDAIKPYDFQRHLHNATQPDNLAFIARLRGVMDRYPDIMTVAEVAADDPIPRVAEYTDGADRFHTAYSFVLLGDRFGAGFIRRTMEEMAERAPAAWPSWAFSNHDVMRVASRWGGQRPSASFVKLLIAVLVSLRGTIFLYQGEELGLPQADVPYDRLRDPEGIAFWPDCKGRDGCRTPIPWVGDAPGAGFSSDAAAAEPWLPVDPAHRPLAVDRQESDPSSPLRFTRRLLAWRRRHPALSTGGMRFLDAPEPVLAFLREPVGGGAAILCVFNLGETAVDFESPVAGEPVAAEFDGLPGEITGGAVRLPGHGGVFARVS